MSDPDRVSLAFIWDTASPHFSRRTFMRTMAFASAAGFVAACGSSSKIGAGSSGSTTRPTFSNKPEAKLLNFYNWTDYIATSTIPSVTRLPTTLESRSVNACWAPITSLFRRLMSAPVSSTSLVLSKYAAVLTTYVVMWLPTGLYLVILDRAGALDLRTAASAYAGVLQVHRDFLLLRDYTSLCAVFIVLYGAAGELPSLPALRYLAML